MTMMLSTTPYSQAMMQLEKRPFLSASQLRAIQAYVIMEGGFVFSDVTSEQIYILFQFLYFYVGL